MRRLLMFVPGLIISAAVLAASAGAVVHVPSGDTCSITGTGTTYTAVINIPANGTEQGAFAFGVPGGTVTNAAAGGTGTVVTTSLPAGTNLALKLPAASVPGASVTASLTTSGPIAGSFTVVPSDREGTTWFDPVVCQHPKAAPTPSNKFTARRAVTYNAKTGVWRELVTVPGPGKLIYAHRTLAAKGTPKPLVWSGRVTASKAGPVTLTLKPTPSGLAALAAGGRIKLSLNIQFSPTNGKPSNQVVPLTLRK